jgi:hypothetical protein
MNWGTMLFPRKKPIIYAALIILLIFGRARAETVTIPAHLEYPTLANLLQHFMYTAPGNRVVVLNELQGCNYIELWSPELAPEGDMLRFGSRIRVQAGMPWMGNCRGPEAWEGFIEVIGKPSLDPDWTLKFHTVNSRLFNSDLEETTVNKIIWELVKTHVHRYLDETSVDLAPPLSEMKEFIPLMVGESSRERVRASFETLRPGDLVVTPEGLRAEIFVDVETPSQKHVDVPAKPLSEKETDDFIRLWETWDAFLVYEIRSFAGLSLTDDEKSELLDLLLDTRYRFVEALTKGDRGKDLVREQFVEAWRKAAPILRRRMAQQDAPGLLRYLTFLSAADALEALDRLGPAFGIEISRDGLRRLARLLNRSGMTPSLIYHYAVDDELRRMMDIESLSEEGYPSDPEGGDEESRLFLAPALRRLSVFSRLPRTAWASDEEYDKKVSDDRHIDVDELVRWLVPAKDKKEYLGRIRDVLAQATEDAIQNGRLNAEHHDLLRDLTPATAWQESCWRQFTVGNGKIRVLRSYNGTSVGLMQINERVWRGIYDQHHLRWNVWYNARAGCRILDLYLRRYVLAKMDPDDPLDAEHLARAVYAVYNGGPGQFRRFVDRAGKDRLYLSDRLFWEKFEMMRDGEWRRILDCL